MMLICEVFDVLHICLIVVDGYEVDDVIVMFIV